MAALLPPDAIADHLSRLPGWRQEGRAIRKTFTFDGFPEAVAFVGRLVAPAQRADHHPDIAIHYRRVEVTFTTHDAGGLTAKDMDGAAAVEAVGP